MGRVKSGIIDKIKEGDQIGKEAVDRGTEIEGDGNEIKSLIDGIDTSIDEDDLAAVRDAETGYGSDFKSAFKEEVGAKTDEMKDIETDSIDEASSEEDKAQDAAGTFQQMSGSSEIGRSNAEGGADRMRDSAGEYQENAGDAQNVIDETESETGSLESSVASIFG